MTTHMLRETKFTLEGKEHLPVPRGSASALCRGRLPCAMARVTGGWTVTGEDTEGAVFFYTTPLGLLIFAEFRGLTEACHDEVYRLCFDNTETDRKENHLLPLLYARDGEAWGWTLTQKLHPGELVGRDLFLRGEEPSALCFGRVVWNHAREPIASR